MGVMRISMLVLPVIRPRVTAARAGCPSCTGSVMTVPAVAAETAVRLALIQSAGSNLLGVAWRVVNRLRVLVLVVEAVGRLRVGVRVLATHLRVNGGSVLVLQSVILGSPVLRCVFVFLVRLAGPLFVAPALTRIMMERAEYRHALVRVLLDPESLRRWHRWHEIR